MTSCLSVYVYINETDNGFSWNLILETFMKIWRENPDFFKVVPSVLIKSLVWVVFEVNISSSAWSSGATWDILVYMGHFINNAEGGKTAEWMMQSKWKLCQLLLKTWGSSTCVHYFPSACPFELTSVRHGVCRRLGYCGSWRPKIVHQDWNFTWQNPTEDHSALLEVCGEQTVELIQFSVGLLVFVMEVSQ